MEYPDFCVHSVERTKEYFDFINHLNYFFKDNRHWNDMDTYYWVKNNDSEVMGKPFAKIVSPKEWIRILLWKTLTYDL